MKDGDRMFVAAEFQVGVDYSLNLDEMVAAANLNPDKRLNEFYPLDKKKKGLEVVSIKIIGFSGFVPLFPMLRALSKYDGYKHTTLPELLALKAQHSDGDPSVLSGLLDNSYIHAPGSRYVGGLDTLFFVPSLELNRIDTCFPIACIGMENHSVAISKKLTAN